MQNFRDYNPATRTTTLNIGTRKSGVTVDVYFIKTPECPKITSMTADCGCSTPRDIGDSVLVKYTPGQLAEGVIASGQNSQNVQKGVLVEFENGTSEKIYFLAKIVA
ncbi:hypothetical protein [Dyadobacter sp. CY312]|uniref:hypothetical protein n=1 Tax=Dyadobacter sp. CY312 TaxID=2907303 RepID=UPI001F48AD02|nr:hypothetical protein [Dyadobacter sp. CY312]MCE7039244.1 hypothetical protein [Dyadobacter sp. CY312]